MQGYAATGRTCARTGKAKNPSLGGEGDLLRATSALLIRPVGMGRASGLGDAATTGQAKPAMRGAGAWSADRRLPDAPAARALLPRLAPAP